MLGSVRAITDGQGQLVARFEYEPFGVTVQASGPVAGREVHKFTGKPEDAAIDLYYFNARYYDPVSGRFISRDPVCEGLNWYAYPAQNPLLFTDPTGMQGWLDEVWGFAKGVAVGAYEGVKATVTGTVDMVLHPIETAKGMFYLVAHPGETWELVKVSASGTWEVVAHGTWEQRGKLIGNVGVQIALAKGVGKLTGTVKAASPADDIIDLNKLHHIFGKPDHKLSAFLEHFGGNQVRAFQVIEQATKAYVLDKSIKGILEVVIEVSGTKLTVRGNVVDGTVKIGTVFIP